MDLNDVAPLKNAAEAVAQNAGCDLKFETFSHRPPLIRFKRKQPPPPSYGACERCGREHTEPVCEHCLELMGTGLDWGPLNLPSPPRVKPNPYIAAIENRTGGKIYIDEIGYDFEPPLETAKRHLAEMRGVPVQYVEFVGTKLDGNAAIGQFNVKVPNTAGSAF